MVGVECVYVECWKQGADRGVGVVAGIRVQRELGVVVLESGCRES